MKNTETTISAEELLAENERRKAALDVPYDPIAGIGCIGERTMLLMTQKTHKVIAPEKVAGCVAYACSDIWVPKQMLADADFKPHMSWTEHARCRSRYDFEFWCRECVTIKDKTTSRNIPFTLNVPQRRVLARLEAMRTAAQPIRLIMLKARQWGGST
ncbi:MAG: hypothetical protein ACI4UW_08295, partial [Muribaculaceae bacterium]